MLHNSNTQLIQFTDQQSCWKNPLKILQTRIKEAIKIPESWK